MSEVPARYSPAMMVLHWATVVAILVAYFLSEGGHRVRLHPPLLHFAFGLSVLVLLAARVLARAAGGAPPLAIQNRPLLGWVTKLGHAVLYLLMAAIPLTGWYAASRLGVSAWFFGLSLPPLTLAVAPGAGLIGKLHQIGGNLILILAGLHAAVALWHQFVWRDRTLQRMLPF